MIRTTEADGRNRDASPVVAGPSQHRQIGRFCVLFAVFILIFTGLTSSAPARRFLHEPLMRLLAKTSGAILSPFGETVAEGNLLDFRAFGVEIVPACDGVLPALIYVAAVLAFPGPWRAKVWGVALGVPAIMLINLTRVVTLMLLGAWRPDLYERVHIYVWQALVIALSMAVWVFWAERFVRPRSMART